MPYVELELTTLRSRVACSTDQAGPALASAHAQPPSSPWKARPHLPLACNRLWILRCPGQSLAPLLPPAPQPLLPITAQALLGCALSCPCFSVFSPAFCVLPSTPSPGWGPVCSLPHPLFCAVSPGAPSALGGHGQSKIRAVGAETQPRFLHQTHCFLAYLHGKLSLALAPVSRK